MSESENSQLTLELPIEESVKLVHPNLYSVLQPNILISGATSNFSLTMFKVFTEVLSIDHKLEPNKFIYSFPYLQLYERTKNPSRNIQNLKSMFSGSTLKLPQDYADKVYDKNFGTEINVFITIIYRNGYVDIELHRDFKKLLVLTNSHYTKGELELLKSFNSEYSHKLYWLVRKAQPFRNTIEYPMGEFRKLMGIADKYPRITDVTTRVLKVAQKDLDGTWASFNYSYIKDGKTAVGVKLYFKSDKKLIEYIKQDIRYEYEKRLSDIGVDIAQVMKYRKLIHDEDLINEKKSKMKWNFYYIGRTIQLVQQNNRVKHKASYTVDALEKAYHLKEIEKDLDDFLSLEIEKHPYGHKIKEGVKVRHKIINRSALMPIEDVEKDLRDFEISMENYLDKMNHHLVTYKNKQYSVNCDLVPVDVENIDDWKINEDIEF